MSKQRTGDERRAQLIDSYVEAPTLLEVADPIDVFSAPPSNPPPRIQQKFVGASYREAYAEAARFVDRALTVWPAGDQSTQKILDFGSGWGRVTRMLLRDFEPQQIWASDVDVSMTSLVNKTLPGVNAATNTPLPPSIFRDGSFDVVTAFSVFSHLSESAHEQWAAEFGRVTKPGGRVYVTVLEENFISQVVGAQAAVAAGDANFFTTNLAKVLPDALSALTRVREGDFVYAGDGSDDDGPRAKSFYGWAVAPRPWMERTWVREGFSIIQWVRTGELFDQAMVVLERTAPKRKRFRIR